MFQFTGVICVNCALGLMCDHKKNHNAEIFSNEVPKEGYFPQRTKDLVTVVASSGTNVQVPPVAS
jgi:hypothetical protein